MLLSRIHFIYTTINLKRKNVAKFVDEFLKQTQGEPIYIKFRTDNGMKEEDRNDPFIIYTPRDSVNHFKTVIQNIGLHHPELLEGTDIKNPFFKNSPNISIAKQPKPYDGYKALDGTFFSAEPSANNYMSFALEDSFKTALGISKEDNLQRALETYIASSDKKQIISKMTNNLRKTIATNESNLYQIDFGNIIQEKPKNDIKVNGLELVNDTKVYDNKFLRDLAKRRETYKIQSGHDEFVLRELDSEVKGMKKYAIANNYQDLNTLNYISLYSEGIDINLMKENQMYFDTIRYHLLSPQRLQQKTQEALQIIGTTNIVYIGSIYPSQNGSLGILEQDEQLMYKKITTDICNPTSPGHQITMPSGR